MKKRIAILLLVIFSVSCEDLDFIQEEPQSEIALTDIDANSLESVILGAYEPFTRSRGRLWESVYATYLDQMTEYSYSQLNLFNDIALYNFDLISPFFNGAIWTSFYESIGRCNFIIDNLSRNTVLSQDVIDTATAEARFVRAISYYNLVRAWGEVPLRISPVASAEEVALQLSSIDAIYEQIIADLINAETFLPERVAEGNEGRATMGAAKVALADVYLTLGNFELARTKSAEVINNQAVFGYELVDSLDLLFSPTSPTNSEEVFAIKFAQINAQGTFLASYSSDPRGIAAGISGGGNAFIHTYADIPFIANWDTADQRRTFNLYNEVVIDGETLPAEIPAANSLRPEPGDFFYSKFQDGGALTSTGAGNDFYLFRYADALLIFAEAENQVNGPTNAAYDAVNQVRRRGYGVDRGTPSAIADFPAGLSQQAFDDLIFDERGYEFFFECKRWFDAKRTGRLATLAVAAGKPAPTADFWPIPLIETNNNPLVE